MSTKHTPGPWNQIVYAGDQHTSIVNADQTHIAAVNKKNDAALISAAPDLLAALQGAIETADGTAGMSEAWWYSPARLAVAKATSPKGK